ncbi:MAG: hypothetical protein M1814_005763 [Vezdaea aestivalis]|nr:MAG: hypothetical protein M1814_005763 [Vezdaea aestivalis]
MSSAKSPEPKPSKASIRPSSSTSIVLISPKNEVLLLLRVKSSPWMPEAHVFPGGNVSAEQDGILPTDGGEFRMHEDNKVYRLCAIRECFEESGILLARGPEGRPLWDMPVASRDEGRKAVHGNETSFTQWLKQEGGKADIEGLIPFTRWITPEHMPRRYSTQMYLYFLPLKDDPEPHESSILNQAIVPTPSSDGGIEHTTATFLSAQEWLDALQARSILLFPPQVYLLSILSQSLFKEQTPSDIDALQRQRDALVTFINSGKPPHGQFCICPEIGRSKDSSGRLKMSLSRPGLGLESHGRIGDRERLVLLDATKPLEPRDVEIVSSRKYGALGEGIRDIKGSKL